MLKFKNEFNTIVIVGNWNSAIFNPEWVSKYLLPDEKLNIEFPLQNIGSIRISTNELRIFTLGNKLNFSILKKSNDVFFKIAELTIKTAELLIHTPVNAFGINFTFEHESNDELEDTIKVNDKEQLELEDYKIIQTEIKRTFQKDDCKLNIRILKNKEKFIFDFNYHYEIKDLIEFKDKFDPENILKLKDESISFLENMYNLKFNNDGV